MTDDTIDPTVRACRDCGEEYRPGIEVCADCGGPIVARRRSDPPGPPAASEEAPPTDLVHPLFVSARARDVVAMCERLREAEIEHRLVEQPATAEGVPPSYGVFVREGDAARALEVVADLIGLHEAGADARAVAEGFDPERGYARCPACGASPPAGAQECPECGLGLGGEEAAAEPGE